MTVPEARVLAAGAAEEGVHFPYILRPGVGGRCHLSYSQRQVALGGRRIPSPPAPRAGALHAAHAVPPGLEERTREVRMDSVSARTAIRKDSDRNKKKMPLNHRRVFF